MAEEKRYSYGNFALNVSSMGQRVGKLSFPFLASLNAADALLSYYLFQRYGLDVEQNPLIRWVLQTDGSVLLFLVLKLGASAILMAYWALANRPRFVIQFSAAGGVVVYLIYFFKELPMIFRVLNV